MHLNEEAKATVGMKDDDPEKLLERAYNLSSSRDTQKLYRDWATSYDKTMIEGLDYLTPKRTADLLGTALSDQSTRILDVGSGTGLAGGCLAELGYTKIDALDLSPEMLGVASTKRVCGIPVYDKLIEADLNKPLELDDCSYGSLICTGTFTHAHVGASCLPELFRILRPGGYFACTVHLDIWDSSGFSSETNRLENEMAIKTQKMTKGKYFATDDEPQGWFILWEKL